MRIFLKFIILFICAIFITYTASAKISKIDRFAQVVDSLHSSMVFPYNVAPGIILTNIGVDKEDRLLVINYTLNPEFVESVLRNASTENGIAQLLTGYDEIFSISMIEAEAGFRTIVTFPTADGINRTQFITVPASAIPIVYSKLKNGDYSSMKPYLEMLENTFSNMQFPLKVVNGVYLINIDSSNITDDIIQHNRINVLNNLRANLNPDYLSEIEDKGITLHYSYLNDKGNILYEFIFTADDLK